MTCIHHPSAPRRGFALLSALWLMMMLSGLGLHIALSARSSRLAAANRIESARTRAGADAGVQHAKARLAAQLQLMDDAGVTDRLGLLDIAYLIPDTIDFGDVRYIVRLRDAGSRININLATVGTLRGLMTALRLDAGLSDRIAQAIVDWRDSDDLSHPRGAERDDYLRRQAPLLPTNGPFAHPDELRDVREVSETVYATLRPFITIAGSGLINPNTADRPVLLSVPGFSPAIVGEIERLRESGVLFTTADQLLAALPVGVRNRAADASAEWRPRLVFQVREIEFESEAWMNSGPARSVTRGTFVRAGSSVMTVDRRAE